MNTLFAIQLTIETDIQGLSYIPDFITATQETDLINYIDQQSWITDLKRRVQHYGYRYDYKARAVTNHAYLGELPQWTAPLTKRLYDEKIFDKNPDQIIVNEYEPGQGISAHVDCVPCFGDVIASLSLGSGAVMQFTNLHSGEKQDIYLQERSLIILSGPARYEWAHAIPSRKSDTVHGFKKERTRRLSLTFRTVIID